MWTLTTESTVAPATISFSFHQLQRNAKEKHRLFLLFTRKHRSGKLSCPRDLSDRPQLANQHAHTRHTTVSNTTFIRQFRILSFPWNFTHRQGQVDHTQIMRDRKIFWTRGRRQTFVGPYVSGRDIFSPWDTWLDGWVVIQTGMEPTTFWLSWGSIYCAYSMPDNFFYRLDLEVKALNNSLNTVSYTHLTLPTRRTV